MMKIYMPVIAVMATEVPDDMSKEELEEFTSSFETEVRLAVDNLDFQGDWEGKINFQYKDGMAVDSKIFDLLNDNNNTLMRLKKELDENV